MKLIFDEQYDKKKEQRKENQMLDYYYWRKSRRENNEPFAMIPSELVTYLSKFKTKALGLYLFYCLKAKNETGESYYSIDRLSEEMKVTPRTINYWNEELEAMGLIARFDATKKSKSTFVLPLSSFYYIKEHQTLEDFLKKEDEKTKEEQEKDLRLRGKLKRALQLVQPNKDTNDVLMCLVYERRTYGTINSEDKELVDTIKTYIFFKKSNYDSYEIPANSFSEISDGVYLLENKHLNKFQSETGIEVTSVFIKDNKTKITSFGEKEVLTTLNSLTENEEVLTNLKKL